MSKPPETAGTAPLFVIDAGMIRYDLEQLAKVSDEERAYDESVRERVTQEDIRRLVEKRRKKRP